MKGRVGAALGTVLVPGTFMNRANRRRAVKLGLTRFAIDPSSVNVGVMAMLTLQEGGLIQPKQRRLQPDKKQDFRKNLILKPTKAEMETPPEEAPPTDATPPVAPTPQAEEVPT